jgi:2-polyprenyl-6-methoxyphenol hydroxylase-like FAD-dependent oxidoreductase
MGIEDTAYPFLLFISQAEIEEVLAHHLTTHGLAVERGVEMTAFQALADGVIATLRHGNGRIEELRARYLVGCDGAHSPVRHGAGIAFEGGAYPQTFVLADLDLDGDLQPGIVHAYIGQRGILFFFPLKHPAPWRMQALWPGPGEAPSDGEPSLEELQAIADASTGKRVRLRAPAWKTYFRVHHRQAAAYRAGRVFLAGDAAHIHSPAGAQGMNTGIQDAWNLGWKLALAARGLGDAGILESYQTERWPIGQAVVRISDRPFKVATAQSRVFRFMRERVAPLLAPLALRSRWMRTYGFRRLGQLALSYRRSPIVTDGRPRLRRGPKAGDRLPDGKVVQEGREVWLQEALAAPKYHLVLCGSRDGWDEDAVAAIQSEPTGLVAVHRIGRQPGAGTLHDPDGRVLARLGVKAAAHYLIRPDGYVGFRAAGTDIRGARSYLARLLSRSSEPS